MSPRRKRILSRRNLLSACCLGLVVALGAYGQNPKESLGGAPASRALGRKAGPPGGPNGEKFKSDQVLVRFRKGTPGSAVAAAHRAAGAHVLRTYSRIEGLHLVRIPPSMTVEEAIQKYHKNHDVLYVEPDFFVQAVTTPNDPTFSSLWGLHNTGQSGGTVDADIDAPEAWDYTTGSSSVVVVVIDSGVDYNHPDLAANIWSNPLDCNANGVDDDGNGYVDDCHGIDTMNHDSDPMDDNEHGTHVSGTIGAVGNNSVGVTGVNWTTSIMACKFLDASGNGATSGAIECLNYVASMKDRGVNILATNNSWGGYVYQQSLLDAVEVTRQRGILLFAAAGNGDGDNVGDNDDTLPFYPANYYAANVVSVAATDRLNNRGSFSNYGLHTVHLGAPGVDILSTTPSNAYKSMNGTSMATPFVTGAAALLKAYNPSLNWKQIRNRLIAGGDTITSMANTVSGKRLNALGALTCSNSTILGRLQPVAPSTMNGTIGTPIKLAMLHINCDVPNGRMRMNVDPIGVGINLMDDGFGPDEEADDGIYSGLFTPRSAGTYTLNFPGGDSVTVQVSALLTGYEYGTTTYNYRTISGTNLNLSDTTTASFTPPFAVPFGGGSSSTVYVGSDGLISFSNGYTSFGNLQIPTTAVQTLVSPFWDDLYPATGTNNNVFWDVLGSTPNRELVVEWKDVKCWICASTETVKFQVVFFEDKSDILFNYADTYFGSSRSSYNYGVGATVGVQISTTSGRQYSYNTASLSDGLAILWRTRSATVTPTSFDFGEVLVGSSNGPHTVTVTNTGGGVVTLSSIEISGGSGGDFSKSTDCSLSPSTLASGTNCTINVTFSPSVGGPRRATLTVTHDVTGSPNRVALSGMGVALELSPTSLTFGARPVSNSSPPQTITVTNHGAQPVSIFDLEVTGINSGDFAPSNNCPVAPSTLAGSASCSINVVFTPGATGARSGMLLMSHDGGASPAAITLAGTGQ